MSRTPTFHPQLRGEQTAREPQRWTSSVGVARSTSTIRNLPPPFQPANFRVQELGPPWQNTGSDRTFSAQASAVLNPFAARSSPTVQNGRFR